MTRGLVHSASGGSTVFRAKQLLFFFAALLGALALALSSCGGKGGGGGSSGPPFIAAELDSFPTGAAPPGFTTNAFVAVLDGDQNSIPGATVTLNGVALAYNAANVEYEGVVAVPPGGAVN